jgi:hypothetical protein
VDYAVRRRFTLQLSFDDIPPTSEDKLRMLLTRSGHATLPCFPSFAEQVARTCDRIVELPLDPLSLVYLLYLGSVGRCPHSVNGFHSQDPLLAACSKAQCRVFKAADGFCPSVGGFTEGLLIFLKRSACGVAALRMARTVKAIRAAIRARNDVAIEQLQHFAGTGAKGEELLEQVVSCYLSDASVTVGDIKTVVPLVGAGGKVWMADEYVAKHFAGSRWAAMQHYVRHTYSGLEDFLREHQSLIAGLADGNGTAEKLLQRAAYAERFNDPYVIHAIQPFVTKPASQARGPKEVAGPLAEQQPAYRSAELLAGN